MRKHKHHFAFLDEGSKREIRRASLKAVAIPGYQVPFASREMPIARGWGTGGLQLTLSLIGKGDKLKVIDQGADDSVNAVNIKKFIKDTTEEVRVVERTEDADIIQSRHRVPEKGLAEDQVLVLQVPIPEPLRFYEASERKTKILHAEADYTGAYLMLFEQINVHGDMTTGADHPVKVQDRYVMAPSPIPKFDNPKLETNPALILFGAGREKKIYAIPPYTKVESLGFEDKKFSIESQEGRTCWRCGAESVFMDELKTVDGTIFQCNDSAYCNDRLEQKEDTL
jgi:alpha-D-ribose 1-methylphosphonate 5-phosphate C-P lyase